MSSFLEPTPRQGGNHISTPSIDWLDEHLGLLFGGHDSQIAVTPGTGAEHNSYRRMSSIICSIRLEYQTIPSPSGSSWRDGKILLIVAEKTPRKNVTGVGVTAKPVFVGKLVFGFVITGLPLIPGCKFASTTKRGSPLKLIP